MEENIEFKKDIENHIQRFNSNSGHIDAMRFGMI